MSKHYQLYSLRIRAVSDDSAIEQALHRTLRYKGAEPIPPPDRIDITLDFGTDRTASCPDDARHLGTSKQGRIGVWKTTDKMFLRRGDTLVDLRPEAGIAKAALGTDVQMAHETQRRSPLFYLMTLSLVILLRYRGWYPLHTAAVAQNGHGVLLVAQSDSGKSTATLNLVRKGWKHLSDDTVLLRSTTDRIRAYSFRRNFCVDPDAVDHFPELGDRTWPSSLSDAKKWQVDIGTIYPGQFAAECTPSAVVLPEIVDAAQSRLEPADTKAVLEHLITQGAFFLTPDRDVAARHLDVLRRLIDQVQTYYLHAGRDARDDEEVLHALLHPLVESDAAS